MARSVIIDGEESVTVEWKWAGALGRRYCHRPSLIMMTCGRRGDIEIGVLPSSRMAILSCHSRAMIYTHCKDCMHDAEETRPAPSSPRSWQCKSFLPLYNYCVGIMCMPLYWYVALAQIVQEIATVMTMIETAIMTRQDGLNKNGRCVPPIRYIDGRIQQGSSSAGSITLARSICISMERQVLGWCSFSYK